MLEFLALPAFQDNYIWLILDPQRQEAAVVDPGDAVPVITWLGRHPEYQLRHVLVTHHHRDHTGGLATLKAATDCRIWGPKAETIAGLDRQLNDGDSISILGQTLQVYAVPGHTLGHIAFYCDDPEEPWLLSGDTLFAGGCGRLFEGTPAQMHASLQRLANLPPATKVFCTHEYTQANLTFAAAVTPDDPVVSERLESVRQARDAGRITLPSTIAEELRSNPFLRAHEPALQRACEDHEPGSAGDDMQCFATLRRWKDNF